MKWLLRLLTFVAVACFLSGSPVVAQKAPLEGNWRDYVSKCLDTLIDHGTDVYGDLHSDPTVLRSLDLATRIVVLQPAVAEELPERLRSRVRVIYQSFSPPGDLPAKREGIFEVCVIGNLRTVKDPFRD